MSYTGPHGHLSLVTCGHAASDQREGENFTFPMSPTTDISCSFLVPSANMQRSSIPLEPLSNSTITYALSIISGTWTQNLVNKCLAKKNLVNKQEGEQKHKGLQNSKIWDFSRMKIFSRASVQKLQVQYSLFKTPSFQIPIFI